MKKVTIKTTVDIVNKNIALLELTKLGLNDDYFLEQINSIIGVFENALEHVEGENNNE